MTEPRDDLEAVCERALRDSSTKGEQKYSVRAQRLAAALRAAYPQLTATESEVEWGVKLVGSGSVFAPDRRDTERGARRVQRMIRNDTRLVQRTGWFTAWEDVPCQPDPSDDPATVERVAKAMYADEWGGDWDELSTLNQELFRTRARAAVRALQGEAS